MLNILKNTSHAKVCFLSVALLLSIQNPALAIIPSKKTKEQLVQMQKEINELREQVQNLRQLKDKQSNIHLQNAEMDVQIQNLQQENQALRGDIELLKQSLNNMQQQNKSFIEDTQFRFKDIEGNKSQNSVQPTTNKQNKSFVPIDIQNKTTTPKQTSSAAKTVIPANAEAAYQQALDSFQKEQNFGKSIAQFEHFTQTHPKHKRIPNAYYWIGENYFALQKYARSIQSMDIVVKRYPNSSKKCSALFMQGKGFSALNKIKEAKLFYQSALEQCKTSTLKQKIQTHLNAL